MKPMCIVAGILALLAISFPASAQSPGGFAAVVSPPRIEMTVSPGESSRQVVEIINAATTPSTFRLRTTDWTLDPKKDWAVDFFDGQEGATAAGTSLQPGSCRPWITLEAREINLGPGAKKRYRFEVAVPAGQPAGECRLAIMVEGAEPSTIKDVPVQVVGRIAIIVYLRVGEAAPDLAVVGVSTALSEGQRYPSVRLSNRGNATARLAGILRGKDASGRSFAFAPSSSPVLPGMTRELLLVPQPDTPNAAPPVLKFPVVIDDKLEWDRFQTPIKATFEAP